MSTIAQVPIADGDERDHSVVFPTSPTTLFDKVDDPVGSPDDASSYIEKTASSGVFLSTFLFPPLGIPADTQVSKVTVYHRLYISPTSPPGIFGADVCSRLFDETAITDALIVSVQGSWTSRSYPILVTPQGEPWTAASVEAAQFGAGGSHQTLFGPAFRVRFTQIYREVEYGELGVAVEADLAPTHDISLSGWDILNGDGRAWKVLSDGSDSTGLREPVGGGSGSAMFRLSKKALAREVFAVRLAIRGEDPARTTPITPAISINGTKYPIGPQMFLPSTVGDISQTIILNPLTSAPFKGADIHSMLAGFDATFSGSTASIYDFGVSVSHNPVPGQSVVRVHPDLIP